MPLNPSELQEILALQKAGDFDQVHAKLALLDTESRKSLVEPTPELIWEGIRTNNDANTVSYTTLCHSAILQAAVAWTRPKTEASPEPTPVANSERFADNLTELADCAELEGYFNAWETLPVAYQETLQRLFTAERLKKLAARDEKTPFYLARGLLRGKLKRIPRWAATLADFPQAIAVHSISLYSEYNHIPRQVERSKDGNGAASIAIFWPDQAQVLSKGRPGITELPKIRNWDPETTPCPLSDETIAELQRWKNRTTLREWGITPAILSQGAKRVTKNIWEQDGQTITQNQHAFQVRGHIIVHHSNPGDYVAAAIKIAPQTVMLTVRSYTFNSDMEVHTEFRAMLKRHKVKIAREIVCQELNEVIQTHPEPGETAGQLLASALIQDPDDLFGLTQVIDNADPPTRAAILQQLRKVVKALEHRELARIETTRENPRGNNHINEFIRKYMMPVGYSPEPDTLATLL